LNLPDKVNSPFLEEWLQKYGADKYLSAQDFNRLRDAINELFSNSQNNPNLYYGKEAGQLLEEILAGMASGQKGIYYDSIEDAMAVEPLPENGVPFCVKPSNETESGIYIYNSEAPNEMWEKIGELPKADSLRFINYSDRFINGIFITSTGSQSNNASYKATPFLP